MKKLFLAWISLFFLSPVSSWAQDDPEYRMEIGAGAGLMGYLGDFNGSLTKDLQPMATILARYNFDTYMGLKFNLSYGKMKGQSTDVETYYPAFDQEPYEFDNSLVDFSLTYEYNFGHMERAVTIEGPNVWHLFSLEVLVERLSVYRGGRRKVFFLIMFR